MASKVIIKRGLMLALLILVLVGLGVLYHTLSSEDSRKQCNILWIVWDTVRADHLSLYDYEKPTTPFLKEWAKQGRVFDNCVSVGNATVATHASWFTGLMPSEHQRNNTDNYLYDEFTTVAELLQQSGYQTYMFSTNPHISRSRNFSQGFDMVEHPWDDKYKDEALRIVRAKITTQDRSSDLPALIRSSKISQWAIKASGALVQRGTQGWLQNRQKDRPYFVFLNYMDAHLPYIPAQSYRKKLMTPEQMSKSYQVDRSWAVMWSYSFGCSQYSDEEIEITRLTYDAAVAELDDLLKNLLTSLEAEGFLDNTVVIVTSDHGEHLGEKHMLDHQYSVYEPLMRIPLVIYYPSKFAPGRDAQPVVNLDLFATILELAGLEVPEQIHSRSLCLLSPQVDRVRMTECPDFPTHWLDAVKQIYADFDPTPWQRNLRAVYKGQHKYIWASDGRCELYDLAVDKYELNNLINRESDIAASLAGIHKDWVVSFVPFKKQSQPGQTLTDEERARLESLGYIGGREK